VTGLFLQEHDLLFRLIKLLTNIQLYYNIEGMIKTIENVLKDLADMQLNLQSDVARTWIAQKVEEALNAREQESEDIIAEVKELTKETTMDVDDVIAYAMESEGYTKGDSGYDMRTGKRDITFHTEDDQQFEVTFRRIWPDD